MTVVSLDSIVKSILLKRGYSIHWYLQYLVYSATCLRELSFDLPLNTIRYKILPVDQTTGNITLPDDYVDWAAVKVRVNQYLVPLVEDNSLNTIPNYDSDFVVQPYIDGVATETNTNTLFTSGYTNPYWWMANYNSFGESLGRQFGGVGTYWDTFKVDTSKNIIKINENLAVTECVLEYIGNGLDADSATHINPYCQAAIEAFCMWQFKENNRTYSEGEAQVAKRDYEQQVTILRGRLSDITVDKLKRIVQKNSIAVKY